MERSPTRQDKNQSRHNLADIDSTYVFDQASGLYKPKSVTEQQYRQSKYQRIWGTLGVRVRTDWITLLVSILTLIVIGTYTEFARRQWVATTVAAKAAKSAARTAKKTLIATTNASHLEQRAWLAITPTNTTFPKFEVGGKFCCDVKATIKIENTGRTPVQMLRGKVRLEVILADAPKLSQHYRLPSFDYSPPIGAKPGAKIVDTPILAPNAAVTIALNDSIGMSDLTDYWPYLTAIYGELKYCDVFSEQHWVNFCLEYRGGDENIPFDISQYGACKGVPSSKNGMDDISLHERCEH